MAFLARAGVVQSTFMMSKSPKMKITAEFSEPASFSVWSGSSPFIMPIKAPGLGFILDTGHF